jgi:hypothetical protein
MLLSMSPSGVQSGRGRTLKEFVQIQKMGGREECVIKVMASEMALAGVCKIGIVYVDS